MPLFPGFERRTISTQDGGVFLRVGGSGPALVLLHGYPQTHVCWHKIAPQLAQHFTVIVPDVRGYGKSTLPVDDPSYYQCSKRAAALDIIEATTQLGFTQFDLVGHDRGARVAYRLGLDHPDKVNKFISLDVVPTIDTWESFDSDLAIEAYHWPFLAQPFPMPERLIEKAPEFYLEHTLASWTKTKDLTSFSDQALACYREAFHSAKSIHAYCNDYRAGASYDLQADKESRLAGKKIQCPMLVLWGAGPLSQTSCDGIDMIKVWQNWCDNVSGQSIDSGHFLAEENPSKTLKLMFKFLL